MTREEFIRKMYEAKYAKKLGLAAYLVGFPVPATHDVCVIGLSREELLELCHGQFEELSPANKAYKTEVLGKKKKNVKAKKHLRLKFKAVELYRYALNSVGGKDSNLWIIPAEEFERCREVVGNLKNQKNRGYALELAILGENWDAFKRGVDVDDDDTEIKYFNGQIEL